MTEPNLFDWTPPPGPRDGATFNPDRDMVRLNRQAADVWAIVRDGEWYGLADISRLSGHPEASVSARLRDLRKPQFGGFTVQREYRGDGLWAYRVVR